MARQARLQYEDLYDIGGAGFNAEGMDGLNDAESLDADKVSDND